MAVKANLGSGLTKIVIRVVAFVTNAIKIMKELIVFIKYKVFELEVFRVAIAEKVGKSVEVIGQ